MIRVKFCQQGRPSLSVAESSSAVFMAMCWILALTMVLAFSSLLVAISAHWSYLAASFWIKPMIETKLSPFEPLAECTSVWFHVSLAVDFYTWSRLTREWSRELLRTFASSRWTSGYSSPHTFASVATVLPQSANWWSLSKLQNLPGNLLVMGDFWSMIVLYYQRLTIRCLIGSQWAYVAAI